MYELRGWHKPARLFGSTCLLALHMIAVSLAMPWAAEAADRLSVSGYLKNYSVAYNPPTTELPDLELAAPMIGVVNNRLRLDFRYRAAQWLSLELSYSPSARVQDHLLFLESPFPIEIGGSPYRVVDLDDRLYPSPNDTAGSFAIFQNLDRARITVKHGSFDLTLGRQPIAWGTARIINPTDVIAPYAYTELDTEDRLGVDAVRLRVPLGFMGEIDAGYVFGDEGEFERSAFFLRGKFYAVRTDISLSVIGFRENLLLGMDMARSIGGAGFWMEGAHVFVDALDEPSSSRGRDYFRASVGLDYSLTDRLYGFVEYHFNQAGTDESEDYIVNAISPAYIDGVAYLLGRHYLIPGATYQITPLVNAVAEILLNMNDPSALLGPAIEYNVAEDIYIACGAQIGIGDGPQLYTEGGKLPYLVKLGSEFGSYPDMYYTSFRWYF